MAKLQVGSKLVEQGTPLPRVLELNSMNFLDDWRVMGSTSRDKLFNQVAASGWHLFYISGHLNTVSLGTDRDDAQGFAAEDRQRRHALQKGDVVVDGHGISL